MRIALVALAALATSSLASAGDELPVSKELAVEPIPEPWRRQASVSRLMLDASIVGSFLGMSIADETRYLAFARFGAGAQYRGNWGGALVAMVDYEVARGLSSRAGVHVQMFDARGWGFSAGAQTAFDDLGASAGFCFFASCIEARVLGLGTGEHVWTAALTILVDARVIISMIEAKRS